MVSIVLKPAELNFSMIAGDSLTVRIVFTERSTGAPTPLAGMTFAAQVREVSTDAAPAVSFAITNSPVAAETNVRVLSLTPDQSDALVRRKTTAIVNSLTGEPVTGAFTVSPATQGYVVRWSGRWDLEVRLPDSQVRTLVAGTISVDLDVTRVIT